METYPTWIRLHPESTDDTMVTSVQARIHDPLWLLGRQWQFGELRHDGGATPIDVRIEGTSSPLTRVARRFGDPAAPPAVRRSSRCRFHSKRSSSAKRFRKPDSTICALRTEAGLHLMRMLRAAGLDSRAAFWVGESPFVRAGDRMDAETRDWFDMVDGRVPDGAALPRVIRAAAGPGEQAATDRSQPKHDPARVDRVGCGAIRSPARRTIDVGSRAHGIRVRGRRHGRDG